MALVLDRILNWVGRRIETLGVLVMVSGRVVAPIHFVNRLWERVQRESSYESDRENLSRTVLPGLEFLVPGDIIATLPVHPTFENVGILGLIVLIRTFLGFAHDVQLHDHGPWERARLFQSGDRESSGHSPPDLSTYHPRRSDPEGVSAGSNGLKRCGNYEVRVPASV